MPGAVVRRWVPFAIVGALLALAQLLLTDPGRGPSWDEAIYLSQVDLHVPDLLFAPQRSRGVVALVAPLVWLGAPLAWIRVTLAVASSAAVVTAAAAWSPMVGTRVAAAAAALAGGSWLVLLYGSEVMPNLWSGLALLGACGLVARGLWRREARPGGSALVLIALAAFVRPLDAALAGAALIAVSAWRTRSWRWPVWLAMAAALGWLPWMLEMSLRYGGPLSALRAAAEIGRVGERGVLDAIVLHLALADGPPIGRPGPIAWPAVAWWVIVGALAFVGMRKAREPARGAARLAAATGGSLLLGYVALIGGEAPRYLLPASLLFAMTAAIGAATVSRPLRLTLALSAIVWGVWQVRVLGDVHASLVAQRADARAAGDLVRTLAGAGDCQILATDDYPQLGYASGCRTRWLQEDGWVGLASGTSGPVFLVTRGPVAPGDDLERAGEAGGYVVYRLMPASPAA